MESDTTSPGPVEARGGGAELDEKDEKALGQLAEELREIYGGVLVAAAVVGEAASDCYRPGRTPLETVVVVDSVTPAVLRAARGSLRRWARRRIPTPLFLDPLYVESAVDTFPLEFMEIAERHRLLVGDPAVFASIRIESTPLRLQVEEQLRGKMLHLWEAYLESGGSRRRLARLLQEPLTGFELALRGLLRLRHGAAAPRPEGRALIDAVAEELDLALPTFGRLEALRLDGARVEGDLDEVFESFLTELRSIVRAIDGMGDPGGPHGR